MAGDNEKAFAKLGQSLALPQTATLAIQGPLVVPLLDDHEREWWPETDYMGMGERRRFLVDAIAAKNRWQTCRTPIPAKPLHF